MGNSSRPPEDRRAQAEGEQEVQTDVLHTSPLEETADAFSTAVAQGWDAEASALWEPPGWVDLTEAGALNPMEGVADSPGLSDWMDTPDAVVSDVPEAASDRATKKARAASSRSSAPSDAAPSQPSKKKKAPSSKSQRKPEPPPSEDESMTERYGSRAETQAALENKIAQLNTRQLQGRF